MKAVGRTKSIVPVALDQLICRLWRDKQRRPRIMVLLGDRRMKDWIIS